MGLMKRDVKVFDKVRALAVLPSAPELHFLPIPGSNDGQRIGRKTNVIKVKCRYHIECPVTGTDYTANPGFQASIAVRIILFVDLQNNTSNTLTSVTLLETSADPFSFFETDNVDRFRILSDRMFLCGAALCNNTGLSSTIVWFEEGGRNSYDVDQRLSLRDGPVETVYNALNAGTSFGDGRDIETGAIYLLPVGTNVNCKLSGTWRYYYTDC